MIRITSISGQVFFQPDKKKGLRVEKIQPIGEVFFQKRDHTNQNEKRLKDNSSNATFGSILQNELNKRI